MTRAAEGQAAPVKEASDRLTPPATTPLIAARCKASAPETFCVRLLSTAQEKQAAAIMREPSGRASRPPAPPSQPTTTPPAMTRAQPRARPRAKRPRSAKQARTAGQDPARVRRREA